MTTAHCDGCYYRLCRRGRCCKYHLRYPCLVPFLPFAFLVSCVGELSLSFHVKQGRGERVRERCTIATTITTQQVGRSLGGVRLPCFIGVRTGGGKRTQDRHRQRKQHFGAGMWYSYSIFVKKGIAKNAVPTPKCCFSLQMSVTTYTSYFLLPGQRSEANNTSL